MHLWVAYGEGRSCEALEGPWSGSRSLCIKIRVGSFAELGQCNEWDGSIGGMGLCSEATYRADHICRSCFCVVANRTAEGIQGHRQSLQCRQRKSREDRRSSGRCIDQQSSGRATSDTDWLFIGSESHLHLSD